jgi:serine/threonine protein kinase
MEGIRLAKDILRGLSHLHSQNLLHRDIKPANIILHESANNTRAKIGDFGSVAKIPEGDESVNASRHSALYVPPEGWENPSRYYRSSDIYQVGMVLHEMANGPLPYDEPETFLNRDLRKELSNSCMSIYELNPADLSHYVDRGIAWHSRRCSLLEKGPESCYVSKKLKRIIRKAILPDRKKRYQSASEFLSALSDLNLPNWKPNNEPNEQCVASDWQGFDWKISVIDDNPKREYQIYRSRAGVSNYRRFKEKSDDLAAILELVEGFRS